jgi:alkaline phosphatase D
MDYRLSMTMTRRDWLRSLASMAAIATPSAACRPQPGDTDTDSGDGLPVYEYDGPMGPETTFEHGVASGDPLANAVLLWTRVTTDDAEPVEVFLEIATDADFTSRVAADWYGTDATTDHCLTVDATSLDPGATYFYRFSSLGRTSNVGRTRTLPDATDQVRLGVCSCSNYGQGYFHSYRHMAQRPDLDVVLHLGDYIYEHASAGHGKTYGETRELDPLNEIVTLEDYRRRYAHYRRDPDLQELHRQNAWIHIWDDHEFANDPYIGGAGNHHDDEGDWEDRVNAALQAYSEWMPTRIARSNEIYRLFDFGGLVRLVMMDRQRRFLWPADDSHYLGDAQGDWLLDTIADTSAQWLLLGNPTTFGPRDEEATQASWDVSSRAGVVEAISLAAIENLVVLTGNIHKFDVLDVVTDPSAYDPDTGAGSVGVEFVVGSITSPGSTSSFSSVPQFFLSDAFHRGYCVVDITEDGAQADFFGFLDALKETPELPDEEHLFSYATGAGANHVVKVDAALASSGERELAP